MLQNDGYWQSFMKLCCSFWLLITWPNVRCMLKVVIGLSFLNIFLSVGPHRMSYPHRRLFSWRYEPNTHTCSPSQTGSCEISLEHVSARPAGTEPRAAARDIIGTSTYVHVNVPAGRRRSANAKSLGQSLENSTRHDEWHVLPHSHMSHRRRGHTQIHHQLCLLKDRCICRWEGMNDTSYK